MFIFRTTTNAVMNTYKSNLTNSYRKLATASEKVQTERQFLSYAEDPAAASKAFELRRSMWATQAQTRNNKNVTAAFEQAWSTVDSVKNKIGVEIGEVSDLRALNGADASARQTLGKAMVEAARSAVQTMNTQYAGNFIFAGADGMNVPFSWGEVEVEQPDGTTEKVEKLMYRGIPVDTPEFNEDGTENEDYKKLKAMADEKVFVDIGLGMMEDGNSEKPIESTVYNSALSGIDFLGYGLDEDGDPLNMISLMMDTGKFLMTCDEEDGAFAQGQEEGMEILNRLTDKLQSSRAKFDVKYDELDTKAGFLKANQKLLETQNDTLNAQLEDVETLDPVEGITALVWAQYCYNAGLKIGTNILSQSLIDYMN